MYIGVGVCSLLVRQLISKEGATTPKIINGLQATNQALVLKIISWTKIY